ncbi:F-box protein AUF1 [Linum grandiflorum]
MEADDYFDRIPDSIVLTVFNSIADVKTLIRCRAVSQRFNSLVPETEWLCLRVDRVIPSSSTAEDPFFNFFKSVVESIQTLFKMGPPDEGFGQGFCSPAEILSGFDRIRRLEIELPSGDMRIMEKGVVVRWRAEFGKTLRSCVIIGFGSGGGGGGGLTEGIKTAVVWTVSALMAASARHCLAGDVVRPGEDMERMVLKDGDGEGTLVMEKDGLAEMAETAEFVGGGAEERRRTVIPAVKMRMRYDGQLVMKNGRSVKTAMLAVVRPFASPVSNDVEDAELAMAAFGSGAYRDVVVALLKRRSFGLEMNPF